MKRLLIFILIILFIHSIYKDLSLGPEISLMENGSIQENIGSVMQIKVLPGDTLFSVIEEIHDGNIFIQREQIVKDFQKLNPNSNPYQLEANMYYFFPVYSHEQ